MAVSARTRKELWARSGNRCALCQRELIAVAQETSRAAVVGDECHIVARESGGPRGDARYRRDLLDHVDNLILLCKADHKAVDDQPEIYTADELRRIKRKHEEHVRVATAPLGRPAPPGARLAVPAVGTVEKKAGVLWSNRADIPKVVEVIRFRGTLLAKTREEDAIGPTWHELYRRTNGTYLVYSEQIVRGDYCVAGLYGLDDGELDDIPMNLASVQERFPGLASAAGLPRIRDLG